MRIVVLRSNPVNPDSRVEKEVESLAEDGHEVCILGWDRSSACDSEDFLTLGRYDVPIFRFGILSKYGAGFKKNLLPLLMFQWKMCLWLFQNKNNYDAIHACDFDTALTGFTCAKLFSKRIVYDIFDYYVDAFGVPRILKKAIESMDRMVINHSDAVIICTEKREEQIRGSKPKKLIVIHNTPNPKYLSKGKVLRRGNDSRFALVYVGILQEGRYLQEVCNIVTKYSDIELHVGGFGKLESFFAKAAQRYDNIYYYGKLAYADTLALEQQCDALFALYDPSVPNHRYSAPNKFYEALMLGKPILMCRGTGFDDVVDQMFLGKIVDYSFESVAEGLKELKNKADSPRFTYTRLNHIYQAKYSWEEMDRRLTNLYKDIAKGIVND